MTYGHLFSYAAGITYPIELESLNFRIIDSGRMIYLASVGRICVTIFAFLTAYGYTKKRDGKKQTSENSPRREYIDSINKSISLILHFIPIYLFTLIIIATKLPGRITHVYGSGIEGLINGLIDAFGMTDIFDSPTLNSNWWYMSFAILIFFLMPFFYDWYEKNKYLTFIALTLFYLYCVRSDIFLRYILSDLICLPLGIFFAKEHIFEKAEKLKSIKIGKKEIRLFKPVLYLIIVFIMLELRLYGNTLVFITDPCLSVIIALFYHEYLSSINPLDKILSASENTPEICGFVSMQFFLLRSRLIYMH